MSAVSNGRTIDGSSAVSYMFSKAVAAGATARLNMVRRRRSITGLFAGRGAASVGRSRGGRNTKIHALADAKGRLIAILLTGGEAHDCPVAERLIRRVVPPKRMLGDKAYDSAELREELGDHGTKPVIPNRCNRKQPFSFSKRLYKLRWRIEAAFNRLKDFRRIATRYDRLARNYLASVCLAAALVWWI
jgi:transposase